MAKPTSGATEPERATARTLADKLMAAHGLREADIPKRQVDKTPPPTPKPFVDVFIWGLGGIRFQFNTQNVVNDGWAFTSPTNTTTGL